MNRTQVLIQSDEAAVVVHQTTQYHSVRNPFIISTIMLIYGTDIVDMGDLSINSTQTTTVLYRKPSKIGILMLLTSSMMRICPNLHVPNAPIQLRGWVEHLFTNM